MTPLVTGAEMQRLDRTTIDEIGIPSLVLMETAGRAVTDVVEERLETERGRVLVLAGSGNNGGDAVVAARHLMNRSFEVTLALFGDRARASADLQHQLAVAERLGIQPISVTTAAELSELLPWHPIVIDGLFGTGLKRPIEGPLAAMIDLVNDSGAWVVAIDLPSGIDADTGAILGTAIRANATVTFALPKIGHLVHPGRACSGQILVADIGIPYALLDRFPPDAWVVDESVIEEALPKRKADAHKGSFGHLLVVAGTPDRPGSALLASKAAARIGAGLVTIGSDDETIRRLAPAFFEIMGASLGAKHPEPDRVLALLDRKSALVIGMSLSAEGAVREMMREVLAKAEVPVLADAGALDAIGPDPSYLARRIHPTVLTPHPGEMARILGTDTKTVQSDRVRVARELAKTSNAIVVLKGASTLVAEPSGTLSVVPTGNPGMATGGSGDVLSGIIGGLLAQGVPAGLAARAGAYLHGLAGDRAKKVRGEAGLVASDLIEHLFEDEERTE
jgi:ADP-dependent NAD(P)H-hydrate dehydratase / NAD(P)H-hydrate epimerase